MTISELCDDVHINACKKGWWDAPRQPPELIALVHSELSEALEEYRKNPDVAVVYQGEGGKPEGFAIELADAVIRIADMAGAYGLDLEAAIELKMRYNETRPFRHGGKTV